MGIPGVGNTSIITLSDYMCPTDTVKWPCEC